MNRLLSSYKKNTGYTTLILVSAIAGLVTFKAITYLNASKSRVGSTEDAVHTTKAESLATEGVQRLKGLLSSITVSNMGQLTANFSDDVGVNCSNGVPVYSSGIVGQSSAEFNSLPIRSPANPNEKITVKAYLSAQGNPCASADISTWQLNYKVEGAYKCQSSFESLCAKKVLSGVLYKGLDSVTTIKVPGTCTTTEPGPITCTSGGSTSVTVTQNQCANNDAYEFKIFNLKSNGTLFKSTEVYPNSGLRYAGGTAMSSDTSQLWKAPLTLL